MKPLKSVRFQSHSNMYKSHSWRGLGLNAPDLGIWAKFAAEAGFDAIDLPLRDLLEQGIPPESVRQTLHSQRLLCGATPFPYDWRAGHGEFLITLKKLEPFLEYAQTIGVTSLYTRVEESVPIGQTRDEALRWHRERLDQIAEMVGKYHLRLGLETVGVISFRNGKLPLMANLKTVRHELAEIIDRHVSLGLLVDAFHLHASNESLEDAVGPLHDRIFGVHVADLPTIVERENIIDHQRALPATSNTVPVTEILQGLASMNCMAPVMIETVKCPKDLQGLQLREALELVMDSFKKVWPSECGFARLSDVK